jgi:hypothetical protein
MRDRERFQHHPSRLEDRLELEKQPRLAHPRVRHSSDDLPVPRSGQSSGVPERVHLARASDEFGQPAPCRTLQPRPQRAEASDFVNVDWVADALDPAGAEWLELEVAFDEPPDTLSDRHRARRC